MLWLYVVACHHEWLCTVKRTHGACHTRPDDKRVSLRTCFGGRGSAHKELSRNRALKGTIFLGKYGCQKNVSFCLKNGRTQGPTSFSRCVGFLWSLRAWRLWASVRVVSYLWCKGACGVATSCWGMHEEDAEKDTRKVEKLETNTRETRNSGKHRGCLKHIWASFRAWWTKAWLPDASGCFSTSYHQQSFV